MLDGKLVHAATAETLYEHVDGFDVGKSDGPADPTPDGEHHSQPEWHAVDIPTDLSVIDIAYTDVPYTVTGEGTIHAPEEA